MTLQELKEHLETKIKNFLVEGSTEYELGQRTAFEYLRWCISQLEAKELRCPKLGCRSKNIRLKKILILKGSNTTYECITCGSEFEVKE